MISVVTITFNNFEELVTTLKSIEGIPNLESIVINGGSCEKTKEFLKTYSGTSVSEKDHGISDAFNKGLARTHGAAVMFLNSGDLLLDKDYINWTNEIFRKHEEIDFVYSGISIKDPEMGIVHVTAENAEERSLAKGLPYPHQTLIIRKRIFNQIGNFKITLKCAMDFDLILRMRKLGSRGKYYPKMTVLMDGAGISSQNDLRVLIENYNVLKDNNQLSFPIKCRLGISLLLIYLKKTMLVNVIKRYRHKLSY
ncbi:MAG: glycosyltransferase [Bacteriovoracaceae bacterium]|nr:glycosyltransferase [Bacteriovoracaceae bacterium]